MDLSKLPKLSDTQSQVPPALQPPPPPPETPSPMPVYHQTPSHPDQLARQPGVGVDIWISVIIGVLLLMLSANFGRWAIAKIQHQPFHTGNFWPDEPPYNGREEEYFELFGYTALSDMGVFLFGAMLLVEAATKAFLILKPGAISRAILMLATLLTLCTVLLNIYAAWKMFNFGITPALSMLAVAFGGWVLYDEVTLLQKPTARYRPEPQYMR